MTMIRIILQFLIFGFLIAHDLIACKCPPPISRDSAVVKGLRNSNLVFYGELIKKDTINGTFTFRIVELFKGNYHKKDVQGSMYGSCSLFPYENGLWIVYADFQKDSLIDISFCGSTISLNKPEGFPPPPFFISNSTEDKSYIKLKWKIELLEKRIQGYSNWFSDLEALRLYKHSKENTKHSFSIDYKLIILIFSLVLNIIMFLTMLMMRTKNARR